ncbi:MAG: hypothetical protein ACI9VM_000579 [Candidatus Azotimanducaceae bacterium]|jgi:hypothetical protein
MNKQTQTEQKTSTNLKDSVISRIETDAVKPKSKWVFLCADCMVWVLWVLVVMVGALAFSESLYVSMHSGIEMYEMTHQSLFSFVIDSLPYVWILTFILMVFLAHYNMRKTRRGYVYPLRHIVISSIVFAVVGGFVFHVAGINKVIDRMVGASLLPYNSVHERQEYLWAHPQDGRITGVFIERFDNTKEVLFSDSVDRQWTVAIHELPPKDVSLLISGKRVRLFGEADIEANPHFFHGCGVMPWIPEEGYTVASLRENRTDARKHMLAFEKEVGAEKENIMPQRCREIMNQLLRTQKNIE